MEITEVRIKLTEDSDDRLQAFCSITFDDSFVVRDLKIIEGTSGPFVAMPSRKLTSHCSRCGCKNHLRASYCNQCGGKLNPDRASRDSEGRAKLYADIAHPINSQCREMIQERVISEYRQELERAKQPGYVSRYEDDFDEDLDVSEDAVLHRKQEPAKPEESGIESRQIEPPASEPRAPHGRAPAEKRQDEQGDRSRAGPGSGFGAGIFDD
jgi:stage V sporulation protein G